MSKPDDLIPEAECRIFGFPLPSPMTEREFNTAFVKTALSLLIHDAEGAVTFNLKEFAALMHVQAQNKDKTLLHARQGEPGRMEVYMESDTYGKLRLARLLAKSLPDLP